MREFLKGLELDKETIDTIMAEHGKLITEAKEKVQELEIKIKDYEGKIEEMGQESSDAKKLEEELNTLKTQIANEKAMKEAEEQDKVLTNNILDVIGDKKFVNDRTKNSIISDIKLALQDKANVGKSTKDLFEEITKDQNDIFVNPNVMVDMPSMGESDVKEETKEMPMFW